MANTTSASQGVKIKLVGKSLLDPMPSAEKVRYILDQVEAGQVLVLEKGLSATEEAQLIQATMAEIDHEKFTGIEMQSYDPETPPANAKGRLRWPLSLGRKTKSRMVVIGPANLLRGVTKDQHSVVAVLFPPAAPAEA